MKILICSDTHGDQQILNDKLAKYPNMDHYFYLGDSEMTSSDTIFETFNSVQGNMDYSGFPSTLLVKDGKITFFLTHGHLFNANQNLVDLAEEGKKLNVQVVCFGHTHKLSANMIDNILLINPGSISQPRNFITEGGTYMILEITEENYQIFCYNRDDELLKLEENPIIFERVK